MANPEVRSLIPTSSGTRAPEVASTRRYACQILGRSTPSYVVVKHPDAKRAPPRVGARAVRSAPITPATAEPDAVSPEDQHRSSPAEPEGSPIQTDATRKTASEEEREQEELQRQDDLKAIEALEQELAEQQRMFDEEQNALFDGVDSVIRKSIKCTNPPLHHGSSARTVKDRLPAKERSSRPRDKSMPGGRRGVDHDDFSPGEIPGGRSDDVGWIGW